MGDAGECKLMGKGIIYLRGENAISYTDINRTI